MDVLFVSVCVMTLLNAVVLAVNVKLTTESLKNYLQTKLRG